MIINKIKLENIRSYTNNEINLSEGSTLLAGDIGTGKSSILLAIDFALFGLRKGNLSGASLLRNGMDKGTVELYFNIDNKDVIIQRNLKRTQDSVVQDSGFIIVNGERRDATAIELKQDILDLLNYPKELLTKSKSLIYRYTVYTPQEEMKSILHGDKDIRLDTLRKVFDIDKYKRVRDNSKLFLNYLKQKRKGYEGQVLDLDDKKLQFKVKKDNLNYLNLRLKEIIPEITKLNNLIKDKRNEIEIIDNKIKIFEELKNDLNLNELKLKNLIEKRDRNLKEIEYLVSSINILDKEIKDFKLDDLEVINKELQDLNDKLSKYEEELLSIAKKINEFEVKKQSSFEIKSKINVLDVCPLCKQNVAHSHKSSINTEEDNKIIGYEKELMVNKDKKSSLQQSINDFKFKLDKLKEKKSSFDLYKFKKDNLKEKIDKKDSLLNEQSILVGEINYYHDKIKAISSRINEFKDLNHEKLKKELEEILHKERKFEIEQATCLSNINETSTTLNDLEKEINLKLNIKNKVTYLKDIDFWIEEYFINIVNLIEKQIMLRVYNDFNALFEKWFNMLMEAENFNVKLNEEFTPLIQQNGHDLNYEYLSGGEKTAVALAYRLALNQVINNLMTLIKTKDLLILDEPTDGFSDEQLDRVRNVLSEINLKQLLIVSHEPKIESFVDNVIRLSKEQHVTRLI